MPEPREADRPAPGGGEPAPPDHDATPGSEPTTPARDVTPGGEAAPPDAMARGYARSRAKADEIRAQLKPLGPDERPLGLKLAVALALFIAAANLAVVVTGAVDESSAGGIAFAVLMCALAAGLWARIYLVILLFQALLAISMIVSTLSLAFASNVLGALLALTVIGVCAPIFWLLIRVMARLQVPAE